MKIRLYSITSLIIMLVSCTTIIEEDITQYEELMKGHEEAILTRSIDSDTTDLGELVCLEQTPDMEALQQIYNRLRLSGSIVSGFIGPPISVVDEFFLSNILAISELPVRIKARSVADGESADYCYLNCDGAEKEVTLTNSSTGSASEFYLKVLPATAGVPYLIYSNVSDTPLCIGHYENNPDKKVLMSAEEDFGLDFSSGWNLLSVLSQGCFVIQCGSYLEQSDPDNPSSIFYPVLEAQAGNSLGFVERESGNAQQEFKIEPLCMFRVLSLEYDLDNAMITSVTPLVVEETRTNVEEYECPLAIDLSLTGEETSIFSTYDGMLALEVLNIHNLRFSRPVPIAGQASLHEVIPDAIYTNKEMKYFTRTVNYSTYINMKPRSYLRLVTRFQKFRLQVPYVLTAKYLGREVKFKGNWTGTIVANPEYYTPVFEPHFYDLDTGVEKSCSLEYDDVNEIYNLNIE